MKNYRIETIETLIKAVDAGEMSQTVESTATESHVMENHYKNRKKYQKIKDFLESRAQGIHVEIEGGYNDKPITIKTWKNNDRSQYSVMKLDSFYMSEPNVGSLVYENWLEMLLNGCVETVQVSFWENVLSDILSDTYLTECDFFISNGMLIQFKNDRAYEITNIADIQGIVKLNLFGDDEESVIINCYDRNIVLKDDNFYIDSEVVA